MFAIVDSQSVFDFHFARQEGEDKAGEMSCPPFWYFSLNTNIVTLFPSVVETKALVLASMDGKGESNVLQTFLISDTF